MPKPAKRGALSRDRILAAALGIVDREGLEAISMRRLGEALGVEAMSLYNHVGNKAEILDGVFEAVLAELPPLSRAGSWTAVLKRRARSLRDVLRAHPNAIPLFATRPAVTPASLAQVEVALDVLRTAGFSAREALSAFQVLVAFVVGHSIATHAPTSDASSPAYDRLDPTEYPRLREIAPLLATHDLDAELELGLEALLAGLESRLKPSTQKSPPRRS
jgi:TetR/AcrR family transcriptional regulator, tetracycline repressor protein